MSTSYVKSHASVENASKVAIVAIFLHVIAWSIGWFSAPYLISSEISPTRIRSMNMSIMMAFHWAYYFGCSRAMPSLLAATDRYAAFIFFASMCSLSLVFVYFCMPVSSLSLLPENNPQSNNRIRKRQEDPSNLSTRCSIALFTLFTKSPILRARMFAVLKVNIRRVSQKTDLWKRGKVFILRGSVELCL